MLVSVGYFPLKSILVVKSMTLFKPFHNQTCLLLLNGTIRMFLDSKNPFAINNINTRRRRYHTPSFVVKKSMILLFHCSSPVWNTHINLKMSWFGCWSGYSMRHTYNKPKQQSHQCARWDKKYHCGYDCAVEK